MIKTTNYKALPFLIMLYITLMLAANVVVYKLTIIATFVMSAGSFIIPCVHILLDLISEQYGYEVAKKTITYGLACQLIFAILCTFAINLPSPAFWHFQQNYDQVLGALIRVFIGSLLGTIIGQFINAKLISRWKILIKGKYFWLRSIGASAIGQLIFSVITISYDMYGVQSWKVISSIIVSSYLIKLIVTVIAATPAAIIAAGLKIYEQSSHNLELNPFKNNHQYNAN